MDQKPLKLLSDTIYYAPLPTLILDLDGSVVDHNIALQALAATKSNGLQELNIDEFMRVAAVEIAGVVSSTLPVGPEPRAIETRNLGDVAVSISTICCSPSRESSCVGRLVFLEPRWSADQGAAEREYHGRYRTLIDHQLVWSDYALSYDQILLLMPYYQEVLQRHARCLIGGGCRRVLDLGAGTGNETACLLAGQLEVVAVDLSRAMLRRLQGKFADEIGRRLTVIEGNAENLGQLPEASFDGISALLTFYDMERPSRALAEAVRLLRPGGTLVITEPKAQFDLELILKHIEQHLANIGRLDELRSDFEVITKANLVLDPSTRASKAPLRAEVICESLRQLGFRPLEIMDSHFGQCATVFGIKP